MCMLPPLLSLMSWLIKANRIYPQRCSALYGLFQKRAITDCLCLCLFFWAALPSPSQKKGQLQILRGNNIKESPPTIVPI